MRATTRATILLGSNELVLVGVLAIDVAAAGVAVVDVVAIDGSHARRDEERADNRHCGGK